MEEVVRMVIVITVAAASLDTLGRIEQNGNTDLPLLIFTFNIIVIEKFKFNFFPFYSHNCKSI